MKIKIFISHTTLDNNKMKSLEKEINKHRDIEPIVIVNRRTPRKLFSKKVKEGIDESDYVIPIITSNSINSQWVNQEIGYAEAKNKKVYPLISKNTLSDLKGFIHKEEDHFVFSDNINNRVEAQNFRKIYLELIKHIIEYEGFEDKSKEKLTPNKYNSAIAKGNRPVNIPYNHTIKKKNSFILLVKTTNSSQIFNAYFQVVNITGDKKWIGYTNNQHSEEYIGKREHAKILYSNIEDSYEIKENIFRRLRQSFPDFSNSNNLRISLIRFRGDKVDDSPVHFYYLIE